MVLCMPKLKTHRLPNAMLLVGALFTVAAAIMVLLARHLYLTERRPSTGLVITIAFAWAITAMIVSVILVSATSGRGRRRASARRGRVTVEMQDATETPPRTTRLTGPGAEMSASADIGITSRLPALFLYAASAGLAAFVIWFHLQGQSTLIGSGVSLMLAFYVSNWARNAWPRTGVPEKP